MDAGLGGFKELLGEFRQLAVWGAGGAAVPFAADLASLSPPWPTGIVVVTSVVELVTLLLVYQFAKSASRSIVNRILMVGALLLAISGTVYLVADSVFTYQVPTTKERFVKGYVCTANAKAVFKDKCPQLDMDDLAGATYEAERLWTSNSIATVRMGLVALWVGSFIALSVVLGSFIVYQAQIPQNSPKAS